MTTMLQEPVPEKLEDLDDLCRSAARVVGRLNRAHGDLVEVTARLVQSELWSGGGFRSLEHWLVVRVGLSPARAREVVRIARRRGEIPATVDRLQAGLVTVDHAAQTTVPQLTRVLAGYVFDVTEPVVASQEAVPGPGTGTGPDPDVDDLRRRRHVHAALRRPRRGRRPARAHPPTNHYTPAGSSSPPTTRLPVHRPGPLAETGVSQGGQQS